MLSPYTFPVPSLSDRHFRDYLQHLGDVQTGAGLPREPKPFHLDNPVISRIDLSAPLIRKVYFDREDEGLILDDLTALVEDVNEYGAPFFSMSLRRSRRFVKQIEFRPTTTVFPVAMPAYRRTARVCRKYACGHAFEPKFQPSPFGPVETRFRPFTTEDYFPDVSPGFWRSGSATQWNDYTLETGRRR